MKKHIFCLFLRKKSSKGTNSSDFGDRQRQKYAWVNSLVQALSQASEEETCNMNDGSTCQGGGRCALPGKNGGMLCGKRVVQGLETAKSAADCRGSVSQAGGLGFLPGSSCS